MKKNYALIGWNDSNKDIRGSITEANTLSKHYSDTIDVYNANSKINIDDIRHSYHRIVYTYQNPNKLLERHKLNFKYCSNDIQYIRPSIASPYKYKTTNGFSVYKENSLFVNYAPIMIPMFNIKETNYDNIVLGYYVRPHYRPDDFKMFLKFLNNLKYDITLYIMGAFVYPFNKFKRIKKLIFEKDNNIFFDKITHYVYSESNIIDPYPTTLQEAVNCNKQIIILKQNRNFKDGINDIENCIEYHTELNHKLYDNSNCILNKWNYDNYYKILFNEDFIYNFNRCKYDNMKKWLEIW